jgi:hypothetical protein
MKSPKPLVGYENVTYASVTYATVGWDIRHQIVGFLGDKIKYFIAFERFSASPGDFPDQQDVPWSNL